MVLFEYQSTHSKYKKLTVMYYILQYIVNNKNGNLGQNTAAYISLNVLGIAISACR